MTRFQFFFPIHVVAAATISQNSKNFRTLLFLWLAWFYALIWSRNVQKEFLMLNWFTTYLHLPLTLEIFPFLSSLIVIFEYLWSHSESEVCLIDILAVADVFAFHFSPLRRNLRFGFPPLRTDCWFCLCFPLRSFGWFFFFGSTSGRL